MAELQQVNQQVCPRCGAGNSCAMAVGDGGAETCWCMGVVISPQALARVPDELKNQACLCPDCAAGRERNKDADREQT